MRIIIADDERHVCQRLLRKVDWESLGVDDVVVCDDGDVILELLAEKPADVLLTDIKMARMDGITAAREALRRQPRLIVVLMSAYDDKEYLKSALDLQAAGYLEKPFTIAQAEEIVKRAVEHVRRIQTANTAVAFAKKQQLRKQKSDLARRLCRFQNDFGELLLEAEDICPEFTGKKSCFAVLFRRREDEDGGWQGEIREDDFFDFLEEKGNALCAEMKNGSMLVLLAEEKAGADRRLKDLYRKLEAAHPTFQWMIAVGSQALGLSEAWRSYQDAVVTLERHFYDRTLILYFEENHREPLELGPEKEESFRILLKSGNQRECMRYLEHLREELPAHDSTLVRSVKNHYFQLAQMILRSLEENGQRPVSEYYLWELFGQMNSLEQLDAFLKDLLRKRFQDRQEDGADQNQIPAILEYIDANLQDPNLSLNEISRKYYVSVTYLCMHFKEETGTTLKAYVIERRMKRAAELLKHTDMKVAEVACAVGFADQGYFTKSFGKYFGISPSRYKEETP
ncbi:MAG: helix-turn-helix domain-containing protein [Eubacteriales bacterium]|nr:helix-turn-helix domain-containing protein [Eubacteriales bacterium]